jgi:hypothetical protein
MNAAGHLRRRKWDMDKSGMDKPSVRQRLASTGADLDRERARQKQARARARLKAAKAL